MWICSVEGFYSVIRWHDGRMCVRARTRDDLTRLRKIIPALSKIEVSPGRDYRYRCFCTVDEWAAGAEALARTIDYGNFKSAVLRERGACGYERALHSIWSRLGRLQPGGPYGFGTRKGFPNVPKGEAKAVAAARAAEAARFSEVDGGRRQQDWRQHVFGGQPRLFGHGAAAGLVCVECGAELESADAVTKDGDVLCRDIGACVERMSLTR